MESSDLLFNETDIRIESGDLVVGFSDEQHVIDIIETNTGEWKEYPQLGVGAHKYLNSSGKEQELNGKILLQLQGDGYIVDDLQVFFDTNGKLTINPYAHRN